jgi:hypothetical protein
MEVDLKELTEITLEVKDMEQDDESVWETLVEKRWEVIMKRRSKNWCFEYVLDRCTEEQFLSHLKEMYQEKTIIQFMIFQFYTLRDGRRKVSGFIRLSKPRNRRGVWSLFWAGGYDMWESVKEMTFPRTRARKLEAAITSQDHNYNFYDVVPYEIINRVRIICETQFDLKIRLFSL